MACLVTRATEPSPTAPDEAATPTACVFGPSPLLTITVEGTVERGAEGSEIHLHAGGQGFWIARMLAQLGLRADLAMPLGGEVGRILETLVSAEGVGIRTATATRGNGAYIHDRRAGERETFADMPPMPLSRHEVDELYSSTLAAGLAADVTVLGGPSTPDVIPADVYRRLAADLGAVGKPVVADLSGETLTEAVAGGVTVLKVSHDDLIDDGRASGDDPAALAEAMQKLTEEGAKHVVVSRAGDPTIAWVDGEMLEVETPEMQRVDHRGAGDSMTAGLAAGLARGLSMADALRLGAAAGASNVTRRGLATGQRQVVEQLAEHIVVRPLDLSRS